MSDHPCLSLFPPLTIIFPSNPQLTIWCIKPLSSFFIMIFEKERKNEKKKEQQLQVQISAAVPFIFAALSVTTARLFETVFAEASFHRASTVYAAFCQTRTRPPRIIRLSFKFLLFYIYHKAIKAKTTRQFPSPQDKENI